MNNKSELVGKLYDAGGVELADCVIHLRGRGIGRYMEMKENDNIKERYEIKIECTLQVLEIDQEFLRWFDQKEA